MVWLKNKMHDNWYPSNCKPIYQYYIPPGETVYLFPLMESRNRERITLSTSYMPNLQNTMEYQVCNLMQFITIPYHQIVGLRVMAYNTIFINISVISWQSVLLVEEIGVPRENHRPATSHWQTLSHNVVSSEWDSISQC